MKEGYPHGTGSNQQQSNVPTLLLSLWHCCGRAMTQTMCILSKRLTDQKFVKLNTKTQETM